MTTIISKNGNYMGYNAVMAQIAFTMPELASLVKLELDVLLEMKQLLIAKPLTPEEEEDGKSEREDLFSFRVPFHLEADGKPVYLWIGIPKSKWKLFEKSDYLLPLTSIGENKFMLL